MSVQKNIVDTTQVNILNVFFFIIIKLDNKNAESWIFEIKNDKHNHVLSILDTYSVLRQMIITQKIKNEIKRQLKIWIVIFFDFFH